MEICSIPLEAKGLDVVLVGGAVVSIYSKGAYQSGDLDFIINSVFKEKLPEFMKEIGFETRKKKGALSRHYTHPECDHLFVEFPSGPVMIGGEYNIIPDEKMYQGQVLKILSPTDCIIDRLESYVYENGGHGSYGERKTFEQAIMVAKQQSFNIEKVKKFCAKFPGILEDFLDTLKKEEK